MNVEIPKEMRHFAQLKIWTENAREHLQWSGERANSGRRGAKQGRSRGPPQYEGVKKHRCGGGGASGDKDDDVTELITQVHMKLSVQQESHVRDLKSATHCTLFLLRDSVIVTDMQMQAEHTTKGW